MRNLIVICLSTCYCAAVSAAPPVDFVRDVEPILDSYCRGCHLADGPEGGFSMDSLDDLLAGGDSGVAVTPGSANSSRMILMLTGQLEPSMPPEGEERPTEEQLERLADWIDQGAIGPSGPRPVKRKLRVPDLAPADGVRLPVTAIAISPERSLRAVARYGRIELLNEDGTLRAALTDQLDKVNALQFSRDGSRLLAASGVTAAYGNALLFSVETGELLAEYTGHRDAMYAAKFSPDETQIATASYDGVILLWDIASGEVVREFHGHNGPVFDLAFSPNGQVLVSGSADETVKVWSTATGDRLDTLGQPEGEVYVVDVTPDGNFVLAGSGDRRLRVWKLISKGSPTINPLAATRFVDKSPVVNFALTDDGATLVVLTQSGNLRAFRTDDWSQTASLEPLEDVGSDLQMADDHTLIIGLLSGDVVQRRLSLNAAEAVAAAPMANAIYMDLGPLAEVDEVALRKEADATTASSNEPHADALQVPRGAVVRGEIAAPDEADVYRWKAHAGEVWAIDADALEESQLDPVIVIRDASGEPVLRTRLQATRSSYFTFRGKNSSQSDDFRLFNWEYLQLSNYLYSAGEVTRLWMHPRGPDSGFMVYPGEGNRWTYFGTSHATHALGEPAYVVRPLAYGESPLQNGLPVFDVYYENDDDPFRYAGKNSRLLFTAPADGEYAIRIADTRGQGGEGYAYRLTIRAAEPSFEPSVQKPNEKLLKGAGREFVVRVKRMDGFEGPVTFEIQNLPPDVASNAPLTIEAGQAYAVGTLWLSEHAEGWDEPVEPTVVAYASINGRRVERKAGSLGALKAGESPSVVPSIHPIDRVVSEDEAWTLQVRRGETASARVVVRRKEGVEQEIPFGNATAGRNASQGVYVDNIGLNGLLVVAGSNEREFFLTADPTAVPGRRSFFLTAQIDGNVTTHPIIVEVLP